MKGMTFSIDYTIKDSAGRSQDFDYRKDKDSKMTLEELLKFTKGTIIRIAKDVLKEEQGRGFDQKPTVVIDNKFGKKEEDVSPLGKIEYVARSNLKEIILEVYRSILFRSKVVTGRYMKGHYVTYNGKQVASNMAELEAWLKTTPRFSPKDKIRFINVTPYARKLENLGITRQSQGKNIKEVTRRKKRSRVKVRVPNGVYALSYNSLRRKYSKNAFIAFDMLPGNQLAVSKISTTEDYENRRFKLGRGAGRLYIYPTILLYAVEAGATDVGVLQ